jgi:hypothetical protein
MSYSLEPTSGPSIDMHESISHRPTLLHVCQVCFWLLTSKDTVLQALMSICNYVSSVALSATIVLGMW